MTKARLLVFLINRLLCLSYWQGIRRVLMLCLWNGNMCFLIVACIWMLVIQIHSILLHSLMRWLHHHSLYLMRVTHIRHLLSIQRFLFAQFARLHSDTLLASMNWCASSCVLVVSWSHILGSSCSLWSLLLSKRHIFWLHHVRRHAKCLLVTSMANTRCSYSLNLSLLHSHHIKGFLRCNSIQNIMVGCLLPTKIGIVIIQSVQNFAKCFIQTWIRLIQTIGLRVMRHWIVTHLLRV